MAEHPDQEGRAGRAGAAFRILTVCTANICGSPVAELLEFARLVSPAA